MSMQLLDEGEQNAVICQWRALLFAEAEIEVNQLELAILIVFHNHSFLSL